jgi:hypothetical protein
VADSDCCDVGVGVGTAVAVDTVGLGGGSVVAVGAVVAVDTVGLGGGSVVAVGTVVAVDSISICPAWFKGPSPRQPVATRTVADRRTSSSAPRER